MTGGRQEEKRMHLNQRGIVNYNLKLKKVARENRKNPTMAENKIWKRILSRQQTGYKFLRQKPIDNFILDFYCSKLLLGIEVDGGFHYERQQKIYDDIRTNRLDILGIKVIRYNNDEVMYNIESVGNDIIKQINIRKKETFNF